MMIYKSSRWLLALILIPLAAWPAIAAPRQRIGRVVRVSDGDTITVLIKQRKVKVRLAGIDCPEINSNQPYGQQARLAVLRLAYRRQVKLVVRGNDRYGRLVATVHVVTRRGFLNLNRELVRLGLAWWYKKYSRDRSVGRLQRDARRARRGLWAGKRPIPPWMWRRGSR